MKPQIVFGKFTTTSGPAAVDLDIGFVPDYLEVAQLDPGATDISQLTAFPAHMSGKSYNIKLGTGPQYTASGITSYDPGAALNANRWKATTAYNVGDLVVPKAPQSPANIGAGYPMVFKCTTAGTSGASEPTWPTTLGGVSGADGTAYWTAVGGGTSTDFSPSEKATAPKGVSIPAAQLVASKTYAYIAFAFDIH